MLDVDEPEYAAVPLADVLEALLLEAREQLADSRDLHLVQEGGDRALLRCD